MNPTVSILILTYNRLDLSKQCIPQILNSIGNISNEVLIWDNCSNDGTLDWLLEYSKADERITKIFWSDENTGVAAINNLSKLSNGKYILKVDNDINVPINFAERLVHAYEEINEKKLIFLGWDMEWGSKTFATRSGLHLYKNTQGKIVNLKSKERIFIHYDPSTFMINGVCRLCLKDKFFEIGGHPKDIIYGSDYPISVSAKKYGYWIGYLNSPDLIKHLGIEEEHNYRKMKDKELKRHSSPLDV